MTTKENYWSTPKMVDKYIAETREDYRNGTSYLLGLLQDIIKNGYSLERDFLVDLGCGPGIFSDILIRTFGFKRLHAIDISQAMLDVLPWYVDLEKTKTSMQRADLTNCRFAVENNTTNLVVSSAAIPYVKSVTTVLTESARILKKGGLLLFDASIHQDKDIDVSRCNDAGWPMTGYSHSLSLVMQTAKTVSLNCILRSALVPSVGFTNVRSEHVVFLFNK